MGSVSAYKIDKKILRRLEMNYFLDGEILCKRLTDFAEMFGWKGNKQIYIYKKMHECVLY